MTAQDRTNIAMTIFFLVVTATLYAWIGIEYLVTH